MKKNPSKKKAKPAELVNGVAITGRESEQLAMADRLAAGRRVDRQRAVALRRTVERAAASRAHERVVSQGLAETQTLARERGEEVEVEAAQEGDFARDADGVLVRVGGLPVFQTRTVERTRIRSRDGLASLHASGSLTDAEWRTALTLRDLAERSGLSLRSQLEERAGGGGGGGSDAFALAGLARAYAGVRVRSVEAAVLASADGARGVELLRRVACEGHALTSVASGGNAKVAALAALRRALALAGRTLHSDGQVGGLRIGDG